VSDTVVVCIKVGDKYGPEYVNKLASMVVRHTTKKYSFLCLTDDPAELECEWKYIDEHYPGWWSKLVLFKPHAALVGKNIVYLDLDTVITGSIDFLFNYKGRVGIIRDWWAPSYNSSVMRISSHANVDYIWRAFVAHADKIMKQLHGDQDFITMMISGSEGVATWDETRVGSYKANKLEAHPSGFSIVCFHGEPKPHQCDGWVKEHWR
jgi:hypothetical protein